MGASRPPARPSTRPSTAPSKTSTAKTVKPPPTRRATMEVQVAWLEPPDEAPISEQPSSSKKRPPRVPGASRTLPPMPVMSSRPPPRPTMEVDMSWVELVDETTAKAPEPVKAKKAAKKPIPREE